MADRLTTIDPQDPLHPLLLATWVLTVAIEIHNARVVEGEKAPATVAGAFEAELLPPPTARRGLRFHDPVRWQVEL